MRMSLSARWFLSMLSIVAVFCVGQVFGMVWLEVAELMHGEGSLSEELAEIGVLLSVSACVFVLMLGGLWLVSKQMISPIRAIAEAADRISNGELHERVASESKTDELTMLASALNRAFDRYNEVVQRLDKFAGNAAHQLRTPLAAIRSLGEVCLQKERSVAEYRDCIGNMLDVAGELTEIVEKLLMIARMNPERVRRLFKPVDLSEVLSQACAVHGAAVQEKDIQINIHNDHPFFVRGERALICQAVGNVMDNAIRFTPPGGKITVTLRNENATTLLKVSDNGPGIPENMRFGLMPRSMEDTYRRELPAGRLGLAIVSEIMQIHEGRLGIESGEGAGTCVTLSWPQVVGADPKFSGLSEVRDGS